MNGAAPLELGQLLHAPDAARREAAWDGLIAAHTRLILAVARSLGGGRDEAMGRYVYVLEKLRENDFRRLRAFRDDRRARFSTWLTVLARRLCLDHHRMQYGRTRTTGNPQESTELRTLRRRLADGIAVDFDVARLPDEGSTALEGEPILRARDAAVAAELALLSSRDRLLLAYRFEDGFTAARIATLLHLPTPFHVYRRLNHLLKQLREVLRSRGIDGSDG